MTGPRSGTRAQERTLRRLILLGFAARLVLLVLTRGTNDTGTWSWFAESVAEDGLARTYLTQIGFNHPPLMGLMVAFVLHVSDATGLPFWLVLKVPGLVAEAATAWLLYRIWSERSSGVAGLQAAAAYALALSPIMISGYHGNTDAIYFSFALAAAYLMESRRAPFWAGLAVAGALNVKLIPLVVVLPLGSRCTRLRDMGRYAAGLLVGGIPFVWAFASFGSDVRRAFVERLLLYRSNVEFWGVELFVRWGQALLDPVVPGLGHLVREAGDLYLGHGGEVVIVAATALAVVHGVVARRAGRAVLDAYELVALGFGLFLVLAPGFGVQYVGCVIAPLIAVSIRRGVIVATTTGVFITAVYAHFVVAWLPVYSLHSEIPARFSPLALLAWGSVVWAMKDVWRPLLQGRDPSPE